MADKPRTMKQILEDESFLDNCSKQVTSRTLDDINVLYSHASNEVQLYDTLLAAVRNRQGWHNLSARIKYEGDDVFLLHGLSVVAPPTEDELRGRLDPYHIDGARNTVGDWTVLINSDGKVTGVEMAGCTSREQAIARGDGPTVGDCKARFIFRTQCDTDPLRKAVEDVKALVEKLMAKEDQPLPAHCPRHNAMVTHGEFRGDTDGSHVVNYACGCRIVDRQNPKAKCGHTNTTTYYDHVVCDDCGWVRTDSGKSWGHAANTWFPSWAAAKAAK